MDLLVKIFVMIGSGASIGFGVWHFFVPRLWNWRHSHWFRCVMCF